MDSKNSDEVQTAIIEKMCKKKKSKASNNKQESLTIATDIGSTSSSAIKSNHVSPSKKLISIKRQSVRPRYHNSSHHIRVKELSDYQDPGPYPTPNTSFSSNESTDHPSGLMGTTLLYKTYNGPEAAPLSPDYPIFSDPCYGFPYSVPTQTYIPPPIWSPILPIPVPVPIFPLVPPPVISMLPAFIPPLSRTSITSYSHSYTDQLYSDNSYVHSSFDGDQSFDQTTPADSFEVNQTPNTSYCLSEDSNKEHFEIDLAYNPILVVDAFCATNLEATDLFWILDLEFGYNPKYNRPVPVYDVQTRIITTETGTPHPGFDKCDEQFKQILMFHYDGAVSSWYLGFMAYYGDKSVLKFQSWLDEMLLRDGMNWMSKYGKNCQFL